MPTPLPPSDAPRLLASSGASGLAEAAALAGMSLVSGEFAADTAVLDLRADADLGAAGRLGSIPKLFLVDPAAPPELLRAAYRLGGADHLAAPADPELLAAKLAGLAAKVRGERDRRLREAALANTPDLVYVFGRDYRFLYANAGLLAMWGRTWEESAGRSLLEVGYEPWHAAMHEREIDQVVATGKPIKGEVPFAGAFGRRLYEYIFNPVFGPGGAVEAVAGTTRDVTDRQAAADALRASEERFRFLDALGVATREASDPHAIMAATTRMLGRHVGVTRCAYADLEADADTFTIRDDWTDGAPSTAGVYSLDLFGPRAASALHAGRTLVIRDIPAELAPDQGAAMFQSIGVQAIICCPLVKEGKLRALMAVHGAAPRDWTAEEIALVEAVVERSWAHIERVRAAAALRDADRRKDEFLAVLAHELRNPLAPLRAGVDALGAAEGQLPPAVRPVRGVMARQVRQMVRLVDDLLDVSRITRGTLELRRTQFDLADAVRDAVEASRPHLDRAGHRVTVTLPEAPLSLVADSARLVQTVGNLLNNAAKYTPPGGAVTVSAEADGEWAVVRVADTGVGFAPEQLPRLFELFSQGDQSKAHTHGGLGIGLSLAKSLAELHGGRLEARSEGPGRGSEFALRLPRERA